MYQNMACDEYRQADADGKIQLSYREYNAIRTIYGAVNAFELYHGQLERRARGVKGLWRDLRLLRWLSKSVLERILKTVPVKKLKQMKAELDNTICEVKVRSISNPKRSELMCIERETVLNICKAATEMNCFCCDKTQAEAKKNCQLYKDIQSVFNYEFEKTEQCPFSDGV